MFFTKGTLVLPPTINTVLISDTFKPASFIALAQQSIVLFTIGVINFSNASLVMVNFSPAKSVSKFEALDNAIFAFSAANLNCCFKTLWSSNESIFICSIQYSMMALSKSSPPKYVSPLVLNTSNTPPLIFNIEMSNVPPPKSYTAIVFSSAGSKPKPYAKLAAVGSLMILKTSNPASFPASLVACLCVSLK